MRTHLQQAVRGMLPLLCASVFLGIIGGCPALGQPAKAAQKRAIPNYDARALVAQQELASGQQRQAGVTLLERRRANVEAFLASPEGARTGARVVLNRHGLPAVFLRDGGSLSAPSTQEPEEIAKSFLRSHAAVFPLAPSEVDRLILTAKDAATDATYLVFTQTLDGVPVFEGQIKFTLNRAGEVIQAGCGGVMPELSLSTRPKLSPEEAVKAASASGGAEGTLRRAPELVIFPLDASTARLAWRLFLEIGGGGLSEVLIDAEDGALLYRHSRVVTAGNGMVWKKSPLAGARESVVFPDAWLAPGAVVTTGNNVDAYVDANGDDTPDALNTTEMQNGRAYSASQSFVFAFGDGTTGANPRTYPAAATTNLFYLVNTAHDFYYGLGFTETAGNYQTNNFGRGGLGNDAVLGEAQYRSSASSDYDNASMEIVPDGTAPHMEVGIITRGTTTKYDDGDFDYDGQVIFHEYAHGVSQHLVGGPNQTSCLDGIQSGGMGEGWSDYFGISFYNDPVMGAYATQNAVKGIRRQSYEGYTFTYEDVGNTGYEVHDDGEIWTAALWDLRKSLGQAVTDKLVIDGLKSTRCNPSMADARDAILAADQATNAGANRAKIWAAFAKHGLGYSATGFDGDVLTGTVYNSATDQPPDLQGGVGNPAITSRPPSEVGLGYVFHYVVTATNPNGGTLNFALNEGPTGMTINPTTGAIDWTAGFVGYRVKVTVTDGKGGKVVHGFFLAVFTHLASGAPVVLSEAKGSAGLAYIDVTADTPVLQVKLRGGTGDADLEVLGPDGTYESSDRSGTSTETLSIPNPKPGKWLIEVNGWAAYSGVALTATLVTPTPLPVNATVTGLGDVVSSENFYRITVPSGTPMFTVSTSGGTGDVDLYLRKGKPAVCQKIFYFFISGGTIYFGYINVETCYYDKSSGLSGNGDTITVTSPAADDWYLDLSGYGAYSGVTLISGTLSVTTPSPLPQASIGAVYSQNLAATGGAPPYTWSIATGALPAGLTLLSAGAITGTPTAGGVSTFTVQVTDSASAIGSKTFSLTVPPPPPSITTSSPLPSGFTGGAYSQTLAATGGTTPYSWSVSSGALPAGLTLSSSSGAISGTPTAAGTSTFTVKVTDSASATATKDLSLTVISVGTLTRAGTLAHIAAGGDWLTTISLINTSSAAVGARLVFHADNGSGVSLPLSVTQGGSTQTVTASTLDRLIDPHTTLVIDAGSPTAPLATGWADVLSSGAVSGFAIFRTKCPTCTASEGTVPLQGSFQSSLYVPYDNTANFVTGSALANLSTTQAAVTATIWDENGTQLGAPTITIAGSGHTALIMPTALPLTAGRRGIVRFQNLAGGSLDGLGLRFSPFGTFTSVPTLFPTVVLPRALTRGGTLSHIAAGGDWLTTISLINTSSAAVTVRLLFYGDNGSALSLPLSVTQAGATQTVTASTLDRVINPNTTLIVDAGSQSSPLVTGWADVLSTGAVSGFAIFRTKCPTCTASEGTVPLRTSFQSSLIVPFDNKASFITGAALANLSTTQTNATATIWDENGAQLTGPAVTVPASGHTSFAVSTTLPNTAGKRGYVQFQNPSGGSLDGLGLRFSPFGTFTSVPTIF